MSIRTRLTPVGQADWRQVMEPAELISRVAEHPGQPIVILGEPGSGKTAMAKRLTEELLRQRRRGEPVPVLIPLSGWSASDRSLEELMVDSLPRRYPGLAAEAKQMVTEGWVVPVLDGLDEVSPSRIRRAAAPTVR